MYAKSLNDLPTLIDKALHEIQPVPIANNHFAVVGYGPSGHDDLALPHTYTIASQVFSVPSNVALTFKRLKTTVGGNVTDSTSDVFSALQYATHLPFRPGVSKTFVLITCDDSVNCQYLQFAQ